MWVFLNSGYHGLHLSRRQGHLADEGDGEEAPGGRQPGGIPRWGGAAGRGREEPIVHAVDLGEHVGQVRVQPHPARTLLAHC